MKDADTWFEEGMQHIEFSWHADYQSELIGDLESAIAAFDRALALQPEHVQAWFQKGVALARLGRHEEAAATFAEAVRLRPDDPELWLQRANSLASLDRCEEALAACDETLRLRPGDTDACFRKAEMLDALGRDANALAAWDDVLRQPNCQTINFHSRTIYVLTADRRRLQACLSRASALARLGRRHAAIAAYRDAIAAGEHEIHGVSPPLAFLNALRHLEPARAAYDEYVRQKSTDPGTWQRAGHAYLCAGRTREALEAYETMVHLVPDNADAWWGKAEALVQAGQPEEAILAYREALSIRPDFMAASARLQVVLNARGASEPEKKRHHGAWKVMGHDT